MIDHLKVLWENTCDVSLKEVARQCCMEKVADDSLSILFTYAGIVALSVILLIVSVLFIVGGRRSKKPLNISRYFLLGSFALTWIFGFLVYEVGMYIDEGLKGLLQVSPMAVVHTFGMFIFESDVSAVHEPFHNNLWYMTWFSLAHFLAALVTSTFIIKHFGYYFSNKLRIIMASSWLSKKKDNLYILWGMNDVTYSLAKSIVDKYEQENKIDTKEELGSYQMVVVRTSEEDEELPTTNSISRFFNILTLRNTDLNRLQGLGCLTMNTFHRSSKLDLSTVNLNTEIHVLKEFLGLGALCDLIQRTKKEVHFFLLTEDSKANVSAMENVMVDACVRNNKCKVHFHCHARKGDLVDIYGKYEQYNLNTVKIHIVDSSELSVLRLKKGISLQGDSHPIHFVDIDTSRGCVTSAFNSLIIGFGEVGQEALSFLYEYSALPTEEKKRMKSHITAFDVKMDTFRRQFYAEHPAFTSKDESEIKLVAGEVGSEEYYNYLEERINDLNYVVIALGNDDLSMNTAVNIFKMAYKLENKDMNKFGIFVHVKNSANYKRMKNIADCLHNGDKNCREIVLFGANHDIFTFDMLIANTYLKQAMAFHKTYNETTNKKTIDLVEEQLWNQDFGDITGLAAKRGTSELVAAQEIIRKTYQNHSNSLHIPTKLILLGLENADSKKLEELMEVVKTRKKYGIEYYDPKQQESKSEWNERFKSLAICEHLRWEAAHIMMGYKATDSYGMATSDRSKMHNCIRDWYSLNDNASDTDKAEGLNDQDVYDRTRSYDCAVVDTTICIALESKNAKFA